MPAKSPVPSSSGSHHNRYEDPPPAHSCESAQAACDAERNARDAKSPTPEVALSNELQHLTPARGMQPGSFQHVRYNINGAMVARIQDQVDRIPALLAQRDALYESLEALRVGSCWCSKTARLRDFDGDHSPACEQARQALAAVDEPV